jgi:transcription elongation factor GreB
MSKAFTRNSDPGDQGDEDEDALPSLPSGSKNYITPQGYARKREELFILIDDERPKVFKIVHWATSNSNRS